MSHPPYVWPWNGDRRPENTALIIIDLQTDFCGTGGYVDMMGSGLSMTQAPIALIKSLLTAMRAKGCTIIRAREGHRRIRPVRGECGADHPRPRRPSPRPGRPAPNKRWRSQQIGAGSGDAGPCGKILIRGEAGWNIIPGLYPEPGEIIIDTPGKGSLRATDLELILRTKGIQNLILTGITTDVCVSARMREANDRGFEYLVVADCCGATDTGN